MVISTEKRSLEIELKELKMALDIEKVKKTAFI